MHIMLYTYRHAILDTPHTICQDLPFRHFTYPLLVVLCEPSYNSVFNAMSMLFNFPAVLAIGQILVLLFDVS